MKRKIFTICLLVTLLFGGVFTGVKAATLSSALASDKPFALLIYTSWNSYDSIYDNMKKLQPAYRNYNFVRVNLNSRDAADLFNGYIVIRQLPMVVIGKQGGKFSQIIDNDCASEYKCMSKKLKRFAR